MNAMNINGLRDELEEGGDAVPPGLDMEAIYQDLEYQERDIEEPDAVQFDPFDEEFVPEDVVEEELMSEWTESTSHVRSPSPGSSRVIPKPGFTGPDPSRLVPHR